MSDLSSQRWRATAPDYADQLRRLLPRGHAWADDPASILQRLLSGLGAALAQLHNRALALLLEVHPETALELLTDWETEVGEPDPCAGAAQTIQERRARVVQKLTARGGQSRAFFAALAESLGYEIEITEYRPFIAGLSRCGGPDQLNGGHDVRFFWSVSVSGPRLTYFRTGSSAAAEKLLTIARAEDLECALQRAAPAHARLIYTYTGV